MMLNRRMPSATLGARGSLTKKPSSSGPRWRMAAAIVRTQDSACAGCAGKTAPQIPHTRLLDLRAGEEGGAGAEQMPAHVETRNAQAPVCVPREKLAQKEKRNGEQKGGKERGERSPLQNQTPIQSLIDRKSTRLNSSHVAISYAVFCLKKKKEMS